jgi:hypothetical protein
MPETRPVAHFARRFLTTSEGTMLVPSHRDLLLAGRVQRRIMPPVPAAPGYEFFVHYQPAYAVGGDYYDFVPVSKGDILVSRRPLRGLGNLPPLDRES